MTRTRARAAAVLAAAALCTSTLSTVAPADAAAKAHHFKNCSALNHTYKHGVGKVGAKDHVSGHSRPVTTFKRSNALYAANKGSDRDHDGIACEKR
jgi:Excalibur calcium-binding domain